MGAFNPLVAGLALKLEASKTAEIDNRAIERAIWRAQARVELFCCFFIKCRLNCINCNPVPRGTRKLPDEAHLNSGLTSADSGLQLDLGDRAKRCLSGYSAPAAYSAVPKIS